MFTRNQIAALVFLMAILPLVAVLGQTQGASQPLTEDKIARMVELKIKPEVIAAMVKKQGLGFAADDAAIERLKTSGAPDVVLDAVRKAGATKPAVAPPAGPVTYRDVVELLNLAIPESEILDRLKASPTTFALSKEQVDELKKLGATENLL